MPYSLRGETNYESIFRSTECVRTCKNLSNVLNQNIINNMGKRSSQRSRTSIKKKRCEVMLRAKFQETSWQTRHKAKLLLFTIVLFVRFLEIA